MRIEKKNCRKVSFATPNLNFFSKGLKIWFLWENFKEENLINLGVTSLTGTCLEQTFKLLFLTKERWYVYIYFYNLQKKNPFFRSPILKTFLLPFCKIFSRTMGLESFLKAMREELRLMDLVLDFWLGSHRVTKTYSQKLLKSIGHSIILVC